jgi:hypothetical protein
MSEVSHGRRRPLSCLKRTALLVFGLSLNGYTNYYVRSCLSCPNIRTVWRGGGFFFMVLLHTAIVRISYLNSPSERLKLDNYVLRSIYLVLKNVLVVYYFSKIAPEHAYHDQKMAGAFSISQSFNHVYAHGVAHLMSCWTHGAKGSRRMNRIVTWKDKGNHHHHHHHPHQTYQVWHPSKPTSMPPRHNYCCNHWNNVSYMDIHTLENHGDFIFRWTVKPVLGSLIQQNIGDQKIMMWWPYICQTVVRQYATIILPDELTGNSPSYHKI